MSLRGWAGVAAVTPGVAPMGMGQGESRGVRGKGALSDGKG